MKTTEATIRLGDTLMSTNNLQKNSWATVDILTRGTFEEQGGWCPPQSCSCFITAADAQKAAAFFSKLSRVMLGVEEA